MRTFFLAKRGMPFSNVSLTDNGFVYMDFNLDGHDGWIFDEQVMNNVARTYNLNVTNITPTTVDGLEVVSVSVTGSGGGTIQRPRPEPAPERVAPAPAPAAVAPAPAPAAVAPAPVVAAPTPTPATEEVTLREVVTETAAAAPSEAASKYPTIAHTFDMSQFEEHLGKKILLHPIPDGQYIKPVKDDYYHIWVYATPEPNKKPDQAASRMLFNQRWSHEVMSFSPSKKGTVINDDAANPVAELVGNNLYVLHHLRYLDSPRRPDHRVLQSLIIKSILGEEKYATMVREINFNQIRDSFSEFCKKMEYKKYDEVKNSVATLRTQHSELSEKLVRTTRELKIAERDLIAYNSDIEKQMGIYHREFDRIKDNPKVINLEITDTEIIVTTVHLTCENPNTKVIHSMGQYRIKINMTPQHFGVNLENLTRKVSNKHHPHSDEHGKPCVGNFGEVLHQLVLANEYSALVIMSIKFIESVTPEDSWGATIKSWPVDPSSPDPNAKKKKVKSESSEEVTLRTVGEDPAEG